MYDSTLVLSGDGTIISIDADINEPLFDPQINYNNRTFISLFRATQVDLLHQFLDNVFISRKLQCIEFLYENHFYQLKSIVTKPDEAICIITNNTRHKKVLRELEENNLNIIIDTYFDAVWSFDTNFTLVNANKAFFEIRNALDHERLKIGDNIFKYVPEANIRKWLPVYERALKGETICFEEERVKNGLPFYVEVYIAPVYNSKKEIIGCLGMTRDITEHKSAQVAIAGYTSQLEEFAFKTSHELRRPIANIMGMTSLLMQKDLGDADRNKTLTYIADSINELDSIAKSMIDLIQTYKK